MLQMLCLLLIWKHERFILNKCAKIFIKDISSIKNTVMFLKHAYSQPTRNSLSVILLFDDNNRNKFRRHKLL